MGFLDLLMSWIGTSFSQKYGTINAKVPGQKRLRPKPTILGQKILGSHFEPKLKFWAAQTPN